MAITALPPTTVHQHVFLNHCKIPFSTKTYTSLSVTGKKQEVTVYFPTFLQAAHCCDGNYETIIIAVYQISFLLLNFGGHSQYIYCWSYYYSTFHSVLSCLMEISGDPHQHLFGMPCDCCMWSVTDEYCI